MKPVGDTGSGCVRYKDLVDDEDHERLTRVLTALEKKDEMQQRMEAITKLVLPPKHANDDALHGSIHVLHGHSMLCMVHSVNGQSMECFLLQLAAWPCIGQHLRMKPEELSVSLSPVSDLPSKQGKGSMSDLKMLTPIVVCFQAECDCLSVQNVWNHIRAQEA